MQRAGVFTAQFFGGGKRTGNYGNEYYSLSISQRSIAQASLIKKGYADAMAAWWENLWTWDYLLKKLGDLAVGYVVGALVARLGIGGALECTNPSYWVKWGLCWTTMMIPGIPPMPDFTCGIPLGNSPHGTCMNSRYIMPIIMCTINSLGVWWNTKGTCMATAPYLMPGVPEGYSACDKCNSDPNRPCTQVRCENLSSSGAAGCYFNTSVNPGQCQPNPDLLKQCNQDAGIKVAVSKIVPGNSSIGGSWNVGTGLKYEAKNIEWNLTAYPINATTNKYSACRYTTNKAAKWADKTPMNDELDGKRHTVTLPMTDVTKLKYTYYVQCLDSCNPAIFSDIAEITITKKQKPDVIGPIITEQWPIPDMLLEGSLTGKNSVTIRVKTDEPAECKYKRFEMAEGQSGFIAYANSINSTASQMIQAGKTAQEMATSFDYLKINYTDPAMAYVGTRGYTLDHSVTLTNLNNSQVP